MKKLGSNDNDKSLDDSDEAPPVDDASLESTWKPVRKEELEERTKRHAIKAKQSSPDEEGEWTSDWKQVRNDEPERVYPVPSTKTFN